ncbi:hypothetical protein SAMN05421828_1222 [Acidiphilium rubrum]|uniref:Uncharacterized protein n=1 Tax=Acidiphilium rubrum TaxID=526 RepID=A0A8G2FF40_ACIRU|nr:hypothetical protein SAMN05421828_1222 [Acidiphilium rubrum]
MDDRDQRNTQLTTDVRVRGGVKNNVIFLAQVAKIF